MAATHKRRKLDNFKTPGRFDWYIPSVADCFILLLWLLVGGFLGSMISVACTHVLGTQAGTEYGMLISYPVMFIPALIYASIKSRNNRLYNTGIKLNSSHFGKIGAFGCAILCSVSVLCVSYCAEPLCNLLPAMPEFLKNALENMTGGILWVDILCVSIFAPLMEEWLCRGMVLRGLLGHGMKPGWAIVASAFFFAFIHLNPWQAIPAFMIGCIMGYVYYKTGCLRLTMLMHCVNNTFAVICSNIPALKDMESWSDVLAPTAYWIIFAACLLMTVLCVLAFTKIKLTYNRGNMDEAPTMFPA